MADRLRILLGKVGLDGHDRGIKVVAKQLADAGMEVIYLGLHNAPEEVAAAALSEDVDVVGISCLSGEHLTVVPAVRQALDEQGVQAAFIVGGVIPWEDVQVLREMGAAAVFPAGTMIAAIVEWLHRHSRNGGKPGAEAQQQP